MFTLSPVSIYIKFQSPRVGYFKADSDFLSILSTSTIITYYIGSQYIICDACIFTLHCILTIYGPLFQPNYILFPVLLLLLVFSVCFYRELKAYFIIYILANLQVLSVLLQQDVLWPGGLRRGRGDLPGSRSQQCTRLHTLPTKGKPRDILPIKSKPRDIYSDHFPHPPRKLLTKIKNGKNLEGREECGKRIKTFEVYPRDSGSFLIDLVSLIFDRSN